MCPGRSRQPLQRKGIETVMPRETGRVNAPGRHQQTWKKAMPKQDLSDYEKRLSIDHERQCRTVLSCQLIWMICKTRKCRRDAACTGPMLASAHQNRKINVQREIGLSGRACAELPACLAHVPETVFQSFQEVKDHLLDHLVKHPEVRLPKFDRYLKGRKSRRDAADP